MNNAWTISLLAGGMAGTAVDTALFPLDTLKTRIQAKEGFWKSGGFRGIYAGLSSAVAGSAPSAALFFVTYDTCKAKLGQLEQTGPLAHMISASSGEVASCLVRVPTEVLKQRLQTGQYQTLWKGIQHVLQHEGFSGFYRGFFTTLFREIPFTCIQFPLYESLKKQVATRMDQPTSFHMALCGSLAGSIAAGLTTPFDVIKTRHMLSRSHLSDIVVCMYKEEGISVFYKGIVPRMMWMGIGGFLFLGVYEQSKKLIQFNSILL